MLTAEGIAPPIGTTTTTALWKSPWLTAHHRQTLLSAEVDVSEQPRTGPDVDLLHQMRVCTPEQCGPWQRVVESSERAGKGLAAISLGDLDESISDVAARGISAEPVDRVGDAGRKAMVIDPDGNRIALLQVTP